MADKFLTYAAVAAGAYLLLARGLPSAAAGRSNGNGIAMPFPEFAPVEPTDSGSFVAPDVIPQTNGVACCMAMTESCLECARRNWAGVTRGALGGLIPRPDQPPSDPSYPSDTLRTYPDYFMRQPAYGYHPVPY